MFLTTTTTHTHVCTCTYNLLTTPQTRLTKVMTPVKSSYGYLKWGPTITGPYSTSHFNLSRIKSEVSRPNPSLLLVFTSLTRVDSCDGSLKSRPVVVISLRILRPLYQVRECLVDHINDSVSCVAFIVVHRPSRLYKVHRGVLCNPPSTSNPFSYPKINNLDKLSPSPTEHPTTRRRVISTRFHPTEK